MATVATSQDLKLHLHDTTELGGVVTGHLNWVFEVAKQLLQTGDPSLYIDDVKDNPEGSLLVHLRLVVSDINLEAGVQVSAKEHIKRYMDTRDIIKDSVFSRDATRRDLPGNVTTKILSYSSDIDVWTFCEPPSVCGDKGSMTVEVVYKLGMTVRY